MTEIKLIDSKTGRCIAEGETVTNFRGEKGTLELARPQEGRNGKLYVRWGKSTTATCCYPSVIGAEFSSGPVVMVGDVAYVRTQESYDTEAASERACGC